MGYWFCVFHLLLLRAVQRLLCIFGVGDLLWLKLGKGHLKGIEATSHWDNTFKLDLAPYLMGDLHDSEIRKRKLITIAAVSAVVSTVTAAAYVLQDFTEEPHGKKTRNLRAVNYKIERVSKTIDEISKSVDPLYFANKLYTELMKVDGFSGEYLESAYQILVKDHVEAEIFLARNIEFRKKMLEGLREKIGNV